jgi:hypothetical protein
MAEKNFDTTKPHNHQCPECWKEVYCRGVNCEIPQRSECFECRNGYVLNWREGEPGYRRYIPQRFEGDTEMVYRG